jgi:hypothetical protein
MDRRIFLKGAGLSAVFAQGGFGGGLTGQTLNFNAEMGALGFSDVLSKWS